MDPLQAESSKQTNMANENENLNVVNKVIQTYAEDMADVIQGDKGGIIKKIIHEEEAYEEEKMTASPELKKNKTLMVVGFVLVLVALSTTFFLFFRKNINIVEIEQQFVPLVFNDKSVFFEVLGQTKDKIAQIVLSEVDTTNVKVGGVEGIYLMENKQVVGLRGFISLIKSSFNPGANTALVSDNFLLGAVLTGLNSTSTTKGDFFMLIKVRDTADIFKSLRDWEGKMFSDLHGFFGIDLTGDTGPLLTKNFEDNIIENKNARVLYDKDGSLVMMYIFADANSVIITASQSAAHEIMLRLSGSQTKQ